MMTQTTLRTWSGVGLVSALALAGSSCRDKTELAPAGKPVEAIVDPAPPLRGAVGDRDLRELLAGIAAKKACEMIAGQFRGARSPDDPDLVTGDLWIRECELENQGTKVELRIAGNGWGRVDKKAKKAGATFAVSQYVRFAMKATIPGTLDLAYEPATHVLSLWFSPARVPDVEVTPVGEVDVDAQGAWSNVAGAVATLFAHSPESMAKSQIDEQGTAAMAKQLATGLSSTIDVCTGLQRFGPGRPPKGEMLPVDIGDSKRVVSEMYPSGALFIGPYAAEHGLTIDVAVTTGLARFAFVCADQAAILAEAYVADRKLPDVPLLLMKDIGGTGRMHIGSTRCPVVVAAFADGGPDTPPVRFSWQRPAGESARSTGGPLIDCATSKK